MSFCVPQLSHLDVLEVTDLSLGPSTDSMIRVGGDYQAQIPEFKPGKLRGERRAGRGRNLRGEDGACGEKYKRQIRFTSTCGEHNRYFYNLLPSPKAEITTSYRKENSS